jgi:hypothetical protein
MGEGELGDIPYGYPIHHTLSSFIMTPNPNPPIRCFTHTSRAYYGPSWLARSAHSDEVIFGHYHFTPEGHDDGTTGEMTMTWEDLGGRHGPAARLNVYHDAWAVLAAMPDLIAALGKMENENITPEGFTALLLSLGFRDITHVTDPRL